MTENSTDEAELHAGTLQNAKPLPQSLSRNPAVKLFDIGTCW